MAAWWMVLVSTGAIRHCAQNDCDLSDSLTCIRVRFTPGSFFFKLLFFFYVVCMARFVIKVWRLSSLSCLSSFCLLSVGVKMWNVEVRASVLVYPCIRFQHPALRFNLYSSHKPGNTWAVLEPRAILPSMMERKIRSFPQAALSEYICHCFRSEELLQAFLTNGSARHIFSVQQLFLPSS